MNAIHDMGGMHGFGPIPYEADEPVFHHDWEGRAYAMVTQTPVPFPVEMRYVIEQMGPTHYLTSTYYEKWLYARTQALIQKDIFSQEELDRRIAYYRDNPEAIVPRVESPEQAARVIRKIHEPRSHRREVEIEPLFKIGDRVKARNMHPSGHTRLPRYVRGKAAVVVKYYGIQEFGDTMPSGQEIEALPLYCVRFEGQELWGESAELNSAIYLDMWERYLEPV